MRIVIKPGGAVVLGVVAATISLTTANAARKSFSVLHAKPGHASPQKAERSGTKVAPKAAAAAAPSNVTAVVVSSPLSFNQTD